MSSTHVAVLLLVLALLWTTLTDFWASSPTGSYGGFVHPDFREVQDVFGKNIESGKEPGASFAVYHNGKVLVDLWGGHADLEAKRQWQHDTLAQVWSCTKGIVAIVVAMLVDRNLLNYSEYVHAYWPEFRQNGKDNITLGMLLSHQAGLVYLGRQISLLEYRDNWGEVERLMAQSTPAWVPGSGYIYHAYTYGMFTDALVRKVDPKHRNISQFFKEEIAEPFDLDFYVGLPRELHYRVARGSFVPIWKNLMASFIEKPSRWKWLPELLPGKTIYNSMKAVDVSNDMNVMNDPELQSIGLSSAVGFGTARSLAKVYDYLAHNGTIQGKQLLSKLQVTALSTPAMLHIPVFAFPGISFAMGTGVDTNVQGQPIFGHRGYGGQSAFADPSNGIGVAYITNHNSKHSESDDPRAHDLMVALYNSLHKYSKGNSES